MFLRLARLARLMRLLRLVKTIEAFDSLYVMTTAIRGSSSILVWAIVLLVIVQMMIALLLQHILESYVEDTSVSEDQRLLVFKYYGTFARTMLTMFEITLGNWMPPCRALVENVSEWFMLFSLVHKLVIGFSVVSVITGVFIQETFKVATTDDTIMMIQKERASLVHRRKMEALFRLADISSDGFVETGGFAAVISAPWVRRWLSAMDLEADAGVLLRLVGDKVQDGRISAAELLECLTRLKGSARSVDLLALSHEQREHRRLIEEAGELQRAALAQQERNQELLREALEERRPSRGVA